MLGWRDQLGRTQLSGANRARKGNAKTSYRKVLLGTNAAGIPPPAWRRYGSSRQASDWCRLRRRRLRSPAALPSVTCSWPRGVTTPRVRGEHCWRWRRDSNPGWGCPHTRFRGALLRPLGHATAEHTTRAGRPGRNRLRGCPGDLRRSPGAGRHTPLRGCRRPPRSGAWRADPGAAGGLYVDGSKVATKVAPDNRHEPVCRAASRSASTSACAVGSLSRSRAFQPTPMIPPSGATTKAPTGTSPLARAVRAADNARPSHCSYCSFRAATR